MAVLGLSSAKPHVLGLDRQAWSELLIAEGFSPVHGASLLKSLHQDGLSCLAARDLPQQFLVHLKSVYQHDSPLKVIQDDLSSDGTRRFIMRLQDGNQIETVYIPETSRGTLCISSQAGCPLDCQFCLTGKQGLKRNLSAAEIIGQLRLAAAMLGPDYPSGRKKISNVVMMGMGEPLLNESQLYPALRIMTDDHAYGLSKHRVTVSTSGVVPAMMRMLEEVDIALAVSLHAPNDALRSQIVPLNEKYPISRLLDACWAYVKQRPKRTVTYEYVMLAGVNDQPEHAAELSRLLKDIPCKLNLIPFNPFPGTQYICSDATVISDFQAYLKAEGLVTTVRKTRGQDIFAACGQLQG